MYTYIYICPLNLLQPDAPMLRLSYLYIGTKIEVRRHTERKYSRRTHGRLIEHTYVYYNTV
jgi:hypothetical protein